MTSAIKSICLLLFLVISQSTIGQTTFDYEKDFKVIRAKTMDKKDKLSYNKLLKRFSTNDPSLTDFEVLALLIGYTAQSINHTVIYSQKEKYTNSMIIRTIKRHWILDLIF
jgi:hypothetical protein